MGKKMKILYSLIYYLSSARVIYNNVFNKCYFELNKTGSTQHKTEACQLIGGAFVDLASKNCE